MNKKYQNEKKRSEGLNFRQIVLILTSLEIILLISGRFFSALPLFFLIPVFLYFMILPSPEKNVKMSRYFYLFIPFILVLASSFYFTFFGGLNGSQEVWNIRTEVSFIVFFVGTIIIMSVKMLKNRSEEESFINYGLVAQTILLYVFYSIFLGLQIFFAKTQDMDAIGAFLTRFSWFPELLIGVSILIKSVFLLRKEEDTGLTEAEMLNPEELTGFEEKLRLLFDDRKVYRRHDLDKEMIARRMNLSISQFDYFMENYVGKSYDIFVAEYRIAYALELMKEKDKKAYSLDMISYECGFKSRAVFDRLFYKIIRFAPSEYVPNTQFAFLNTMSGQRIYQCMN